MKQRLNFYPQFPEAFAKLNELDGLIKSSSVEEELLHLIKIRVSQINSCTFCLDMHIKEAKIGGVKEIKLHHLAAWKESQLFSEKERAALLWAEDVTKLAQASVDDNLFTHVREHFNEKELVELTMAIALINAWNRFGVAFRSTPGSLDKYFGLEKAGL